ncbi:MAG: hypothetical protein AABW68_01830 [archaeon]
MRVILDSAVFINTDSFPFDARDEYVMPSACEEEVKERVAKLRLDTALDQHSNFTITDPCSSSVLSVRRYAAAQGNTRLSLADEAVLALAFESVERKEKVMVYTDDYSIQNALKWAHVPFSGIQQKGITQKRRFATRRK